jgi:transposase
MYSDFVVQMAIRLYNKHMSLRKVAEIIGIHYSTISRWKNMKK